MAGAVLQIPAMRNREFLDVAEHCPAVVALSKSSYRAVRRVRCFVRGGVARLEGSVPTYYQKQLAQEIVRHAEGVQRVDNRTIVTNWG